MSGSLTYHLTADDLEAAYRARMRKISQSHFAAMLLFGITLGLGLAWLDGPLSIRNTLTFIAAMLAWILVVLVVIIVGLRWFWLKRYAHRIYQQQRDFHGQVSINWSDTGFESSTDTGTVRLAWADYHAWKRTDKMLLLYRSEAMFHFIPLRVTGADEAADEIVASLTEHGVKEAKS